MKKLLVCLLAALFLMPTVIAFAQDDDDAFSIQFTRFRNRMDHVIRSISNTSDDVQEYIEDDVDLRLKATRGDCSAILWFEWADNTFSDDAGYHPSENVSEFLKGYEFDWSPSSLADKEFTLRMGNYYGMEFGKLIQSYNGETRGNFSAMWKMGNVNAELEYRRVYEGNKVDDTDGDEHRISGMFTMPLGESGFSFGAFGAFDTASDIALIGDIKGNASFFLGSVEFTGAVNDVSFFAEAGMASGTMDVGLEVGEGVYLSAEEDLSGFYAIAGAEFTFGQVTLGVEGGFGSGDDNAADDKDEAFLGASDYWVDGVMHDYWGHINDGNGGVQNLTFGKLSASMDPTDKLSLTVTAAYFKPTEEVASMYDEHKTADTYGMDFAVYADYTITDYLSYHLYLAYAMPDEDFMKDNKYVLRNRLEFAF